MEKIKLYFLRIFFIFIDFILIGLMYDSILRQEYIGTIIMEFLIFGVCMIFTFISFAPESNE